MTAHVPSASARFHEARKRRVGYQLSLVLQGMWPVTHFVRAAKHLASVLATCEHGPRPEQLELLTVVAHPAINAVVI